MGVRIPLPGLPSLPCLSTSCVDSPESACMSIIRVEEKSATKWLATISVAYLCMHQNSKPVNVIHGVEGVVISGREEHDRERV